MRGYYEALLTALPDLRIDVKRRYGAADALAYEVTISGTHLGPWRGIPATGRRVMFPLVAIYTFAPDNRLAGERIYYDRAMVLRQLGLFREPDNPARAYRHRTGSSLDRDHGLCTAVMGERPLMLFWWRRRKERQQQVIRDADNLVALFGDAAYSKAVAQARHEYEAGGDPSLWLVVRREVAGPSLGSTSGWTRRRGMSAASCRPDRL